MCVTATNWTLDGFEDHFDSVHRRADPKFVWILGAGASKASGIPLGADLVDKWLKEMHLREDDRKRPLEEWATAERLGLNGFTFETRASFYTGIYHRRFCAYPEDGYACLENLMSGDGIAPSVGYYFLAKALEANPPRHNVVITTNFDNLVADSLSIYTKTSPLVVGHESLAGFARATMRRPLICKIHRDVLLSPQSDPRSLRRLHDAWGTALRALFQQYTPLFIGYGGNDDTLMDLLESLDPEDVKPRLIWCYYEKIKPNPRVRELVNSFKGVLVPIPSFDHLMARLGAKMGIRTLDNELVERAKRQTSHYHSQMNLLVEGLKKVDEPVREALRVMNKDVPGWYAFYLKIQLEKDPNLREQEYRLGIQLYPESAQLRGNFANFMKESSFGEAKKLYLEAIELDPKDANITGNFATFMTDQLREHAAAEALYEKALALDPRNPVVTENFAIFLDQQERDDKKAERLYLTAFELEPTAMRAHHYANFLFDVLDLRPEARAWYVKALELDPENVDVTNDYATFLWQVGRYIEPDELFRKALRLDPDDPSVAGNYGGFLLSYEQLDEATKNIERAKSLNRGERNQLAAELAFYEAILLQVEKQDATSKIQDLEKLLLGRFVRHRWRFEPVLAYLRKSLSAADYDRFSKLAFRIPKLRRRPQLEVNFQKWTSSIDPSTDLNGRSGRKGAGATFDDQLPYEGDELRVEGAGGMADE